jgi:3-dehydroquinate synthetase
LTAEAGRTPSGIAARLGYAHYASEDWPDFLQRLAAQNGVRRAFILTDERVKSRARRAERALRQGCEVKTRAFHLSERRKSMGTVNDSVEWLARSSADRESLVVGVGGGIATDTFGFAAAIYMRGIHFVPVATTLVAMADAALGGKSGVNLRSGKNLAGVFRNPLAVVHDLSALNTLPRAQIREGLAEVVKAAIISGGEPFERLEASAGKPYADWDWPAIVQAACALKAEIVAGDRLERGRRELLNLGHTFGHAFERTTGYRVSHGQAVALGLRAAGLLALQTNRFSPPEHARVVGLLAALRLPVALAGLRTRDLLDAMQHDKKTRDGTLRFVLPRAIGDVEFGIEAPLSALRTTIAAIGKAPAGDELN